MLPIEVGRKCYLERYGGSVTYIGRKEVLPREVVRKCYLERREEVLL